MEMHATLQSIEALRRRMLIAGTAVLHERKPALESAESSTQDIKDNDLQRVQPKSDQDAERTVRGSSQV